MLIKVILLRILCFAWIGLGFIFAFTATTEPQIHLYGTALVAMGSIGLVLTVKQVKHSSIATNPLMGLFARKWLNFKQTWRMGVSIMIAVVGSFYALHLDAVENADAMWPVIAFFVSTILSMAYWVHLTVRQPT